MTTKAMDWARIRVDAAFASGVGMCLDRVARKSTGRVFTPPPLRNSVTTTSSKEKVKDRRPADTIPGQMVGRATRRKVVTSSAPRFIVTSSMDRSNSRRLTMSTTMTIGMQKVACPTMMDAYPKSHVVPR